MMKIINWVPFKEIALKDLSQKELLKMLEEAQKEIGNLELTITRRDKEIDKLREKDNNNPYIYPLGKRNPFEVGDIYPNPHEIWDWNPYRLWDPIPLIWGGTSDYCHQLNWVITHC